MAITRHPLSGPQPAWARVPTDQAAIARLRASFQAIAADGPRFAAIFYAKLFERYPGVRAMFPSDTRNQEKKLTDSLASVLTLLEAPEQVQAQLMELGARHLKYGVKNEHYPIVRDLLVEAMGEAAGKGWGPVLAAEWTQALHIVCTVMIEGAARAGQQAPAQGQ